MKTKKLLMIPGPTPVARSIQDQMGRETVAFGDPTFVKDFKELLEDLKVLFHCSGEVFVVAGTGTMGMEMAIANTTKRDDNILIVSHGFFGDRFIDLCKRKGLNADVLSSPWGEIIPVEKIKEKLKEKKYAAITVTHVDTSTGVCAPIAEIGEMLKEHPETLYIVDGVCATAGEPEYADEMGIDVLFTGSQKAFGVSPGLTMLWVSQKAMERRRSLGDIPESYIDFEKWLPVMKDPSKYYATPAVNLVWALKESVRIIKEEGIENRYNRHKKYARAMQEALVTLGFGILAEEGCRAVTLSNLIYPEGTDDVKFRGLLAEEGIMVAGGLAAYAGKMFRLGHMGNVDKHDLISVIATIERALYRADLPVEFGKALGVLQKHLI